MKERSYNISVGELSLTVTYFIDGLGVGRQEPLGAVFDRISSIHHHAEYEIFFVQNGAMELVTEKENRRFADSVVILPPFLGHYTVTSAERLFVIYLNIDRADGENGKSLVEKLASGVLSLDVNDEEKFYLEKLSSTTSPSDSYHILSLLFSELIFRIEPLALKNGSEKKKVGKYAFALEEFIEKHYSEKIRLSDVAKALYLCERQVTRVIKKEYGCSFSEYVNRKRMSVAMMMLRHTDMTISEIARKVGFENDNYFYRLFKDEFGETPTEYRLNNTETNSSKRRV